MSTHTTRVKRDTKRVKRVTTEVKPDTTQVKQDTTQTKPDTTKSLKKNVKMLAEKIYKDAVEKYEEVVHFEKRKMEEQRLRMDNRYHKKGRIITQYPLTTEQKCFNDILSGITRQDRKVYTKKPNTVSTEITKTRVLKTAKSKVKMDTPASISTIVTPEEVLQSEQISFKLPKSHFSESEIRKSRKFSDIMQPSEWWPSKASKRESKMFSKSTRVHSTPSKRTFKFPTKHNSYLPIMFLFAVLMTSIMIPLGMKPKKEITEPIVKEPVKTPNGIMIDLLEDDVIEAKYVKLMENEWEEYFDDKTGSKYYLGGRVDEIGMFGPATYLLKYQNGDPDEYYHYEYTPEEVDEYSSSGIINIKKF